MLLKDYTQAETCEGMKRSYRRAAERMLFYRGQQQEMIGYSNRKLGRESAAPHEGVLVGERGTVMKELIPSCGRLVAGCRRHPRLERHVTAAGGEQRDKQSDLRQKLRFRYRLGRIVVIFPETGYAESPMRMVAVSAGQGQ